jgi:hypothetical protein
MVVVVNLEAGNHGRQQHQQQQQQQQQAAVPAAAAAAHSSRNSLERCLEAWMLCRVMPRRAISSLTDFSR